MLSVVLPAAAAGFVVWRTVGSPKADVGTFALGSAAIASCAIAIVSVIELTKLWKTLRG
jgi:hypothetical protein